MTTISVKTGSPLQAAPQTRVASGIQESKPVTRAAVAPEQFAIDGQGTKTSSTGKAVASPEELKRITEELERHISTLAPNLEFSVDESSGKSVMKFTDRTTNEVIRQFPSLEALEITKALDQFRRGLLINKQV